MIESKLIKKTIVPSGTGKPIVTFELTYPLFIHAELLTHRVFSRNCASARAIPAKRMIELAKATSTAPERFRYNQAGMAGGGVLSDFDNEIAHHIWQDAMLKAIACVEELTDPSGPNVHKQWANRLLMPFTHMRTVLTGTEFGNFFDLRSGELEDSGAQDEISILANQMEHQYNTTKSQTSICHIPYVDHIPGVTNNLESMTDALIRSIAKISRISYMREDRETTITDDARQVIRLNSGKFHASPFEHQAFDRHMINRFRSGFGECLNGNFCHQFAQLRHSKPIMDSVMSRSFELANCQ